MEVAEKRYQQILIIVSRIHRIRASNTNAVESGHVILKTGTLFVEAVDAEEEPRS